MEWPTFDRVPNRALATASRLEQRLHIFASRHQRDERNVLTASPLTARLRKPLIESSCDLHEYLAQPESRRGTILYLAYGSNLSKETFRDNRGIEPLSQVNVQVPSLRLTFDLPGLPYTEPCFANTGSRDPNNDPPKAQNGETYDEKALLLGCQSEKRRYRKDDWHKGLIGVVYEVTPEDYAHIIVTEGGGSSYNDILVECHPFASSDPSAPVPQNPSSPAFKAHTLFAPATPKSDISSDDGGRFQRPDTSYAQASARYLKLLTDGADECGLPYEYQDYLKSIRPYTIISNKQRVGQFVYLSIWMPFIVMIFALGRMFADENGVLPDWLKQLTAAIFKASWGSYDGFFKPSFGDGERSVPDGGGEMGDEQTRAVDVLQRHTPDIEKAMCDAC